MTDQSTGRQKVRVAIVGVGNCASALVQGVEFYKDAQEGDFVRLRDSRRRSLAVWICGSRALQAAQGDGRCTSQVPFHSLCGLHEGSSLKYVHSLCQYRAKCHQHG